MKNDHLPAMPPPESACSGAILPTQALIAARRIYLLPLLAYRRFLSPFIPPSCRFHPSCSAYALEAVTRHGIFRGSWLAFHRILRCQPLCEGGLDPVPDHRSSRPT